MYILGLKAKSVFICICICECLSNPCTPRLHLQELSTNLSPSMLSFGIRASISLNCTGVDGIICTAYSMAEHNSLQNTASIISALHCISVQKYCISVQSTVQLYTASIISALYCIYQWYISDISVQALSAIACQCTALTYTAVSYNTVQTPEYSHLILNPSSHVYSISLLSELKL